MDFRPLRKALPTLLHMRTEGTDEAHWLRATIAQIVSEVDRPRTGGLSMLERLTEIIFIELLRHQILAARAGSVGWLAALADPSLARCLALIHDDPNRDWSVPDLAKAAGLSRSTLAERFEAVLGTSPMRYVRDWRLYLASVALRTTGRGIAAISHDAGYGTEAAFNRAFARAYGAPPAAWRQKARSSR
jgi:AraC-like DNA-binding protein